ncbi:hypothetical protein SASPL_149569 [Salvia splendens]|uniref:UspA domain-containing protein n=1 Tax=Salvia splendens TaxID=180675 RepID=A0A8X8WCT7_SALSN|nr:uncharacterized protein LOC121778350 [Salvia splendens]KAG6391809.1 hypothetical protein SASPL_149569 [Salvia splendens]
MDPAVACTPARSPSQQDQRTIASFIEAQGETDWFSEFSFNPESEFGNKVMVVVDNSHEARVALEYALSKDLQSNDTIVLLHVARINENTNREIDPKAYDLLNTSKNICQQKKPEVRVVMTVREGVDKGATIVEEAKQERVSYLVLGQRKKSFLGRLRMFWAYKRNESGFVDYCIQNAECKTFSVRRRNRKIGGFLINTKHLKNFWLLA